MGKGFWGVGVVSLMVFLSSCVTTQTQVKETEGPEVKAEVKEEHPKEEAKTEAPAPAPVEAHAPEVAAPEAAATEVPEVEAPDRKSVV